MIEILFTMSLVALAVGFVLVNMRSPRTSAGTQGLAQVIADELRLARQTAISRQLPVAVAFPTRAGAVPHTQGLYVLSGEALPKITRVKNFAGDFPGAVVANVFWTAPGLTAAQPIAATTGSDQYPVDTWIPTGSASDYVFMFTPSGVVRSNGAPLFEGNFHLLVTQGLEYNAGAPPGAGSLSYWQPTRVCQPYTITLTPSGTVTVSRGVLRSNLPEVATGLSIAGVARPPSLLLAANNPPAIRDIQLFPISSDPLPAGSQVQICPGQHVTLRVEASDADGDDLFCLWSANAGRFTSPNRDRMEWDPTIQRWVSYWEWVPSPTMQPDDRVRMTCQVFDRSDGTSGAVDSTVRTVVMGRSGRVVFHLANEDAYYDIAMVNFDGTGERLLTDTPEEDEQNPSFSPDGSQIAFQAYSEDTGSTELFIMNYDGSGIRQVTSTPDMDEEGPFEWSPDGTRLGLFCYDWNGAGWGRDLQIINADGSQRITVGQEGSWGWYGEAPMTWHRSGNAVIFAEDDGSLWHFNLGTSTRTLVLDDSLTNPNPDTQLISPHWSPTNDQLALIESYYFGPLDEEVFLVNVNVNGAVTPGSYRRLLPTYWDATWEFAPNWDPSGAWVGFDSAKWYGEQGKVYVCNPSSNTVQLVADGTGPVAWTPNGNVLYQSYYNEYDPGQVSILLSEMLGGWQRTLTTREGDHEINRQPASVR